MNRTFQITIAASDKTSDVAKKIVAQLDKLPLALDKTTKAGDKLTRGGYVQALEKSFANMARRAADMAITTAKLVPAVGVLAGLGSAAGIAALATGFGKAATQLRNTAAGLGVSTEELQKYRAAARFAGLEASDMDGALMGLGSALESSSKGNNTLLAVMKQYGIVATRNRDGSIDLADGLRQVDAAARGITNMQARREFLGLFGLESINPMIGRLDALIAKAREAGLVIADPKAALEFEQQMVRMRIATERFVYQIGAAIAPAAGDFAKAITKMTDGLSGKVAEKAAAVSRDLAHWVNSVNWSQVAADAGVYLDKLDNIATVTGRVIDLLPGGKKREAKPQWNTQYDPQLTWNQRLAKAFGGSIDQASQIKAWERAEGLPPGALDALYAAESGRGRNSGTSPKGAMGPFQFMPETGAQYGLKSREDFFDFQKSGAAAARYLGDLYRQNGGNIERAFAAYNWGPGNLAKFGMDSMPDETRNYLRTTRREMGTAQTASGTITPPKVELSIKVDAPSGAKVSTRAAGDVLPNVKVGRTTIADGPF